MITDSVAYLDLQAKMPASGRHYCTGIAVLLRLPTTHARHWQALKWHHEYKRCVVHQYISTCVQYMPATGGHFTGVFFGSLVGLVGFFGWLFAMSRYYQHRSPALLAYCICPPLAGTRDVCAALFANTAAFICSTYLLLAGTPLGFFSVFWLAFCYI